MATAHPISPFPAQRARSSSGTRCGKESNSSRGNLMRSALIRQISVAVLLCVPGSGNLVAGQTTDWKDYLGGPAASHYSPLKQIDVHNVDKLEVAWSYPTGDESSYTFSPLVIDNIAYVAAKKGSLVALDATTGKELWVHQFPGGFGMFSGIAGQRGCNYWESKDRSDRRIFVTAA